MLLIWLFVVLIINSSYTASLTSLLTVQELTSGIQGLDSLISSSSAIGYQVGSFSRNYLVDELNIAESRLVPLNSASDYARALELGSGNGGVAAIIDELPYVEIFLSKYCKFKTVGQVFTKSGWGFVSGFVCCNQNTCTHALAFLFRISFDGTVFCCRPSQGTPLLPRTCQQQS